MDRDSLIGWLNDAHAMETELMPILRNHARDLTAMPAARRRMEQHLTETETHAARVRTAVESLGGSISTVKSGLASVAGSLLSVGGALFTDELVKNGLTDYAAEQFEVAAYTALAAAADELGELEVARLCLQNLKEDEAMAEWLRLQLPKLVRKTLRDEEAAQTR